MPEIWTPTEEATRLAARFNGVNQAKFARDYRVPGGPSMVSQHIKNRRPITLEAATAYAAGFGCEISDISPRLAEQVSRATNGAQTTSTVAASGTATQSKPSLAVALEMLGDAIADAEPEARADVLKMLDIYVGNPRANAGQVPLIVGRLLGEMPAIEQQRRTGTR